MSESKVSERLKYLRKSAKITQNELAKATGVSRSTIAELETLETDDPGVRVDKLIRICRYLNVFLDYLLCLTDDPLAHNNLIRNGFLLSDEENGFVLDLLQVAKPELYKKLTKGLDKDEGKIQKNN